MHIINVSLVKKLFPFIISIVPLLIALNHGVYSLALIPGVFLIAVAFNSPFNAFLIYTFFFFHPLASLLRTITGCMALISFGLYWLVEKKQLIIDFTFLLFIASFITFSLSGIINESLPGNSIEAFTMGIFYIFMYTLMLNVINSKERLRTLFIFIIFLCVLLSFLASLEFIFNVDLFMGLGRHFGSVMISAPDETFRPNGSHRDPDEMSMMLLYGIPFITGVALNTHNIIWKRFLYLMVLFVIFGMILGFSRTAFISLVILILVFFFYNLKVKYLKYYIFVLIFLGMILLIKGGVFIQRFRGFSHFGDLETWNENTTSLHIRYLQYQAFGVLFKEYPIFGIGPGNFLTKTDMYDFELLTRGRGVNNIFMNVTMDSGIIGLSVYIVLLLHTWKNLVKSQKIVQKSNDLEMLSYIRAIKYAFWGCLFALQAAGEYFAFPVIMSIGLSGAVNQIVSSSTQIKKKGLD